MLQILSSHDISDRRATGAYYTSDKIAEALANWAIRTPTDRVLEPSFGGGALIYASISRLLALDSGISRDQIVGYDIDGSARELLTQKLTRPDDAVLSTADFLSVYPSKDGRQFDCIIANPPFVRHHRNKDASFKNRCEKLGLPKSADLWCLFVIHALQFMKRGGRLALVLPASFLFADYAAIVRQTLRARFGKVKIIRLAFKAFAEAGAEEKGVLILAENFDVDSSKAWSEAIAWSEADLSTIAQDAYVAPLTVTAELAELTREASTVHFDDLATIRIGVVTGANRFFVINNETASKYRLPEEALLPVVGRTSQIDGLKFGLKEHAIADRRNERIWLLSPTNIGSPSNPVRRYLETIPEEIRRETLWFRKRANWFEPEPIYADAVFTYMNHQGPRIALLSSQITATNTFHLLTLKNGRRYYDKQKLALGFLSSLAQASAEVEGRAYGGGLLKLEPAGLKQILLPKADPRPEVLRKAFLQADAYLRAGDIPAARAIADRVLLFPALAKDPEKTAVSLKRLIQYSRSIRTNGAKQEPR